MKSVVYEASSIAKAVEHAWIKAGQPVEFSIKVLEEPRKNFIGFTTRSAKIALFFDYQGPLKQSESSKKTVSSDAAKTAQIGKPMGNITGTGGHGLRKTTSPSPSSMRHTETHGEGQPTRRPRTTTHQRTQEPRFQERAPERHGERVYDHGYSSQNQAKPDSSSAQTRVKKDQGPLWNDAMVVLVQEWLSTTLKAMNRDTVMFTITPSHFHLRVLLSEPILPDIQKEKKLLATFATLILETLKRTFKTGLRGHKIVLIHASMGLSEHTANPQ